MAGPLILARTFKEAHSYAQDTLGLRIGYYRVVNAPGTIKAVRGVDIHLVPGWDKRPDRFSMRGALRYCRLNIIDPSSDSPAEAPAKPLQHWVSPDAGMVHAIPATGPIEVSEAPEGVTCPECLAAMPVPEPVVEVDERWADTGYTRNIAERYNTLRSLETVVKDDEPEIEVQAGPSAAPAGQAPSEPDPEPVEAPEPVTEEPAAPKRRRRKCAKCENLHFKTDPCPPEDV